MTRARKRRGRGSLSSETKRRRGASRQGQTSRPTDMASQTKHQHSKREVERFERYYENRRAELKETMEQNYKALQTKFSEKSDGGSPDKKERFKTWCQEHCEFLFPRIDTTAYCVPPCFVFQHKVKERPGTGGALERTRKPEPSQGRDDDSDVRGDLAESAVERAFRLLNNVFEREEEKKKGTATMFIITKYLYQNMFKWLEVESRRQTTNWTKIQQKYNKVTLTSAQLQREQDRYFERPIDARVERHQSDLLVFHKMKGVIFVQVKSTDRKEEMIDRFSGDTIQTNKKRLEKALQQLKDDKKIFDKVMENQRPKEGFKYHLVLALPNMNTKQDVLDYDIPEQSLRGITLLLKGNLIPHPPEEMIDLAERDYSLSSFISWWNGLTDQPMDIDIIKDAIARYIGDFSLPRELSDKSEVNHMRYTCDAIQMVSRLFTRRIITDEQADHLKTEEKWVHLRGLPGSGRTTMLKIKASMFLKEHEKHKVVVLDINRGTAGRPVGYETFRDIQDEAPGRTHHECFDVNEEGNQYSELKTRFKAEDRKHLLFLIDEALPEKFWCNLLKLLKSEFKDSHVWCADGLEPAILDNVEIIDLKKILRIPPTVQNVLFHADWNDLRKRLYTADAGRLGEVACNGLITISLHHDGHSHGDKSQLLVADCKQCAEQLVDAFRKMKLVKTDDAAEQGASSTPSFYLPCRIAILFSVRRDLYKAEKGGNVEITFDDFKRYADEIDNCPFIKHLRKELKVDVTVMTRVDEDLERTDEDLERSDSQNHILVTSVDMFQGLERDVIVFLPVDPACSSSASAAGSGMPAAGREILLPGFAPQETRRTRSSSRSESPRQKRSPVQKPSPHTSPKSRPELSDLRLASMYWQKSDVSRYSEWDRTMLVFAATRCTAQLVLLTP